MKIILSALFLFFLLVIAGCAASHVKTEWDTASNLRQYHSFRFTDSTRQKEVSPSQPAASLNNAIHAQITEELEKRGIKEQHKPADLLIAYHTYTKKKRDTVDNHYPMMYGGEAWRFYPWNIAPYPYGYWQTYDRRLYVYTEGTLIIDVIAAQSKQLVWRGSLSDVISDDTSELHDDVVKAVHLIFRKFPVKPHRPKERSTTAVTLNE
jgi:hypothetical protein